MSQAAQASLREKGTSVNLSTNSTRVDDFGVTNDVCARRLGASNGRRDGGFGVCGGGAVQGACMYTRFTPTLSNR